MFLPFRYMVPGTPPPASGALTQDNLTYLGGFVFPATVNGLGTNGLNGCLALRWVGGQLRFFSVLSGDHVFELNYPGISLTPAGWPTATLNTYWDDIWQSSRCGLSGGVYNCTNAGSAVFGLYWDEIDQRLYWNYGIGYGSDQGSPQLGYSTLNDVTGHGTGAGCWAVVPDQTKAARGGMLGIPTAFAATYMGGKRLAAGFGGYYNIGQNTSLGPSLIAFAPPTLPTKSQIPFQALQLYSPYSGSDAPGPGADRGHRNPYYSASNWGPTGGVGWLQESDTMGGGCWVDIPASGGNPGVSGVITSAGLQQGLREYTHAQIQSDHYESWFFITDPADLAQVALGNKQPYEIQPSSSILWPFNQVVNINRGMAFDSVQNRLYIIVPTGKAVGSTAIPVVHVYQVTDTPIPSAPSIVIPPGTSTVNTAVSLAARFNVLANGVPAPSYVWETSPDSITWSPVAQMGDTPPGNLPGAAGPYMYYTPTTLAENNLKVRVTITNSQGSVVSSSGTLSITGTAPIAPTITVQPTDVTAQVGHQATLSFTVTGHPPLSKGDITWFKSDDGGATFTILNDDNNSTIAFTATLDLNGYKYKARCTTQGFPIVWTNVITLTVTP